VTTTAPLDLRGEAVIVTVREQRDYIYDFNFQVQWEAKIGEALTKAAVVKGENKTVFLGYPTYRGSFVFSEVSNDLRKEGKEIEVAVRFEKGNKPPTPRLRKFLNDALGTAERGLQATLLRFVRAFEEDYHQVTSIAQSSTGISTPVPLAVLPAPWTWAPNFRKEDKEEAAGGSGAEGGGGGGEDGGDGGDGGDGDGKGDGKKFSLEHKMEELRGQGYMVFQDADDAKKK
jgi:hypothetical protein